MIDQHLINILNNISTLLEIKGENPFKARAYTNAANLIKSQDLDVHQLVADGELGKVKGFGKALVEKITDYCENGTMQYYEKLLQDIPESLLTISKIKGIGPKKVKLLYETHEITNIDQLEEYALDGRLEKVKGFSKKTVSELILSISFIRAHIGLKLQRQIKEEVDKFIEQLLSYEEVTNAEAAGEYRRFSETIKELVILIGLEEGANNGILENKEIKKTIYTLKSLELNVNVIVCSESKFYTKLHLLTGPRDYIEVLDKLGIGLHENSAKSEEEIYENLGIQYIRPELRDNLENIELAKKFEIPKLVENSDLKGMIHLHTTWSDGNQSIREMSIAAKEMGFSYIAVSDHSRSAAYANGLSIERVREQHREIDQLNEEGLGIHILKSIESDILIDGSLDYPEEVLAEFDLVIASIHSGFHLSEKQMTDRIIYAMRSPYFHILGHPTGRLLLSREAYPVDMNAVIEAAAEYGKVIEINSSPYRLDLSWQNTIYAKKLGVKVSINPDAHRISSLQDVWNGVKVAQKASLSPKEIINCMPLDEFKKYIDGIGK
jgi:DNA polymerase (family 10)